MIAGKLIGEIEAPRPLRARAGQIAVSGWCVASGQAQPPQVRMVVGSTVLSSGGHSRRPDVAALLPAEPSAGFSGFVIQGRLPAGVHEASFEAQGAGGTWQAFKRLSLVVEAAPFVAELDEPIRSGILRDRVKVGGWALDPRQAVRSVSLRYGHREMPCILGRPRTDVPAAYPGVPHAAGAGFESEDFLVAGHGPVRIRARLADGSMRVVPTPVTFSVETDENHPPGLGLDGARLGLDSRRPAHATDAAAKSERPRNILFILPGSFSANSALHVAALANELSAAGHACAVAVSHDLSTLSHHERPAFRGLLHSEAAQGVTFPNGRGPDLLHAWTTRENVRRLAGALRQRHGCQLIVHLEDNEQEILAQTLQKPWEEIMRMPPAELDRLVPPDLSHPHHGRAFLSGADGVTVITDRLREFVPADRPVHTIWPAADSRSFGPRPKPAELRRILDPRPGTTVLFYHGNVHAANVAEVRELYAAVLELNRGGESTVLIRTGLDTVELPGDLAGAVAPHVLALGQITHHRHLPPLMSLADIFVQPGRPDAFNDYRFPSKLPEFFAIGRPVVLPRTNLGTALRHGVDAWVLDRADAAGIAGAVRELRRDPELAERLSRGALAYAAAHFNWSKSAAALARFYGTVAAS